MMKRNLGLCLFLIVLGITVPQVGVAQEESLQPIAVENVSALRQIEVLGEPVYMTAQESPNKAFLAVGSVNHGVWLYRSGDLITPFCFLPPPDTRLGRLLEIQISPDSRILAVASGLFFSGRHYQIALWDVESCSPKLTVSDMDDSNVILEITFNQEGNWIAASYLDGKVMVWETNTGQVVTNLQAFEWFANQVTFSNDSSLIAVNNSELKQQGIWSTQDWQPNTAAPIAEDWTTLRVEPNGTFQIIPPLNYQGTLPSRFQSSPLPSNIDVLALSPDGTKLAVFGYGVGVLYDLTTIPVQVVIYRAYGYIGKHIEFSPNGEAFLTLTTMDVREAGAVEVWNSENGELQAQIRWGDDQLHVLGTEIEDATFAPDSHHIFTRRLEVKEWNIDALPEQSGTIVTSPNDDNWGNNVVLSPDHKLRAVISSRDTVQIWDETSQQQIGEIKCRADVMGLTFNLDNTLLATGNQQGWISFWSVDTLQLVYELKADDIPSFWSGFGLAFSPDGTRLYSGGASGVVRVWGVRE